MWAAELGSGRAVLGPHWNQPWPAPLKRICSRWSERLEIGPDCRSELGLDQPAAYPLGGLVYFPDARATPSSDVHTLISWVLEQHLFFSIPPPSLPELTVLVGFREALREPFKPAVRKLAAAAEERSFAIVVGGEARRLFEAARENPDRDRLALLPGPCRKWFDNTTPIASRQEITTWLHSDAETRIARVQIINCESRFALAPIAQNLASSRASIEPDVARLLKRVYELSELNDHFGPERDLQFSVELGAPFHRIVFCGLGVFPPQAPVIPVVPSTYPSPRSVTRRDVLEDAASVWLLNATSHQAVRLLVKLCDSVNFRQGLGNRLGDMLARSVVADLPW